MCHPETMKLPGTFLVFKARCLMTQFTKSHPGRITGWIVIMDKHKTGTILVQLWWPGREMVERWIETAFRDSWI